MEHLSPLPPLPDAMKSGAGLWSIILAACSLICTVAALVCLSLLVFTDSDGDTVAAADTSTPDAGPVIVTVTQGAEYTTETSADPSPVGRCGDADARDIFCDPSGNRTVIFELRRGGVGSVSVEQESSVLAEWRVSWESEINEYGSSYSLVFLESTIDSTDPVLRAIPEGARLGGVLDGSEMTVDYHNEPHRLTCNGTWEELSCGS